MADAGKCNRKSAAVKPRQQALDKKNVLVLRNTPLEMTAPTSPKRIRMENALIVHAPLRLVPTVGAAIIVLWLSQVLWVSNLTSTGCMSSTVCASLHGIIFHRLPLHTRLADTSVHPVRTRLSKPSKDHSFLLACSVNFNSMTHRLA